MNVEFNPNEITQDYAKQLADHYKRINYKLGIKQDIKRNTDGISSFISEIVDCKPKPRAQPELVIVLTDNEKEFIKEGQLKPYGETKTDFLPIKSVMYKVCAAYDTTYEKTKQQDRSSKGQRIRANIIQTLFVMYDGNIPEYTLAEVFQLDISSIKNMIALFDIDKNVKIKNFSNIKCGYYSLNRKKKNMQHQQRRVKRR